MSIGRNTAYNLIGFAIPTVLGLVAVPLYLDLIGPARFGVMALAWLVLGYFGLFDLGLGRATAQRIAAASDDDDATRRILATSLLANLVIGLAAGALLYPVARYLFAQVFDLPPGLRGEVLRAVPLLALALPAATTVGVLGGALMGRGRFRQSNAISVVSTTLFQFLPLAVAWANGPDLVPVMAAAIIARLLGAGLLWRCCRRTFGTLGPADADRRELRPLMAFGGWVTVASLIGPLMVFFDRFLIGALLGPVAVTIYTVPMDAMRRLTGAALALANSLFPRFAIARDDEARRLSRDAIAILYAIFTPGTGAALVAMDPAMRIWLGDPIGGQAAPLARLFLIATWMNCFAQIPFTRLQASGQPDRIARLLMLEVPFYLAALWLALVHHGLAGAAWVFLVRIAMDALALAWLAQRRINHGKTIAATAMLFCGAALALERLPPLSVGQAVGWATLAGLVLLWPAWRIAPAAITERSVEAMRAVRLR
ncbi:MAG: oligosaccharide flippase family protein [Novosphingobium sp.]